MAGDWYMFLVCIFLYNFIMYKIIIFPLLHFLHHYPKFYYWIIVLLMVICYCFYFTFNLRPSSFRGVVFVWPSAWSPVKFSKYFQLILFIWPASEMQSEFHIYYLIWDNFSAQDHHPAWSSFWHVSIYLKPYFCGQRMMNTS